uniref:Uncharacterized protein n=1 Tax=Cacopsylla melanoneura TaxID=428564 RepID=A0A8D9EH02_9HEMI
MVANVDKDSFAVDRNSCLSLANVLNSAIDLTFSHSFTSLDHILLGLPLPLGRSQSPSITSSSSSPLDPLSTCPANLIFLSRIMFSHSKCVFPILLSTSLFVILSCQLILSILR